MSKPTVFIVEDDPTLKQVFSITLQDEFDVEAFGNGNDALQRLNEKAPGLIVLDLNLPGASGEEILSHIHTVNHLAQTRIILATADDQQANMLSEKSDVVLLKPISPAQLRELAKRLCALSPGE
jgi:CheY-like chemotaxis protein